MNKTELRKLILEVMREAEETETASEDPKNNPDSSAEPSHPLDKKYDNAEKDDDSEREERRRERGEERGTDMNLILSLRGLPKNKESMKKVLKGMSSLVKQEINLDTIHAELERDGKKVISMDQADLAVSSKLNKQNQPQTQPLPAIGKKTQVGKPELPRDIPGYNPDDWEKATQHDTQDALKREKLKKAKIAAGTYNADTDTDLWSDADWDEWSTGKKKEKGKNQSYKVQQGQKPNAKLGLGTLK